MVAEHWSNITGALPVGSAYISNLTVKALIPLTVWVTFSGYNASYKIYKTTMAHYLEQMFTGNLTQRSCQLCVMINC